MPAAEATIAERTVLAVEDSPVHLKIVTRYIEQVLGCRVMRADGVEAAVEALLREVPDLIISDLMMPNLDGLDFVQILAVRDEWRSVPIVIHSAANHLSGIRALSEFGVKGYILKPFDAAVVLPRLQRVLASHPVRSDRHPVPSAPISAGRIPIVVVTRRAEIAAAVVQAAGPLYEVVTVDSGPAAIVRTLEINPWLVLVCADAGMWAAEKTRRALLSLKAVPRVRIASIPFNDDAAVPAAVLHHVGDGPFELQGTSTLKVLVRDNFTTGCLAALKALLDERIQQGVARITFDIPYESLETAALSVVSALARKYRR